MWNSFKLFLQNIEWSCRMDYLFPGRKRTLALLNWMVGLLAAGKSDNLTKLTAACHAMGGVSSVWAPNKHQWGFSKPRLLKTDNKEPLCLFVQLFAWIERLEETLRMRSSRPNQVASVKITAWRAPHGPKPTFCTASVLNEEVSWDYSALPETYMRMISRYQMAKQFTQGLGELHKGPS